MKLNFFTPISYGSKKTTFSNTLLERVDNYFFLGGKKARVIQSGKVEKVQLFEEKVSILEKMAKVASYLFLSAPMLLAKLILRSTHQFEVVSQEKEIIQKVTKFTPHRFDFSTITPGNIDEIFEIESLFDYENAREGELFLKKEEQGSFYQARMGFDPRKQDAHTSTSIGSQDFSFAVEEGKFTFNYLTRGVYTKASFADLKDFFDFLFKGDFYQGDTFQRSPHLILKRKDGTEVTYKNPYLKS